MRWIFIQFLRAPVVPWPSLLDPALSTTLMEHDLTLPGPGLVVKHPLEGFLRRSITPELSDMCLLRVTEEEGCEGSTDGQWPPALPTSVSE